jgi:hypothetical protein
MEDSTTIKLYSRDRTLQKEHVAKKETVTCLQYIERNCFSNCIKNMDALQTLAGCELVLTAGSFGVCNPSPTWYEWGGLFDTPHTKVSHFVACPFTGLPSVHFWFETRDGKIWDVLDPYILLG